MLRHLLTSAALTLATAPALASGSSGAVPDVAIGAYASGSEYEYQYDPDSDSNLLVQTATIFAQGGAGNPTASGAARGQSASGTASLAAGGTVSAAAALASVVVVDSASAIPVSAGGGTVDYHFEIYGHNKAVVSIPVIVNSSMVANTSGNGFASAYLTISLGSYGNAREYERSLTSSYSDFGSGDFDVTDLVVGCCSEIKTRSATSMSFEDNLTLFSNVIYDVQLYALALGGRSLYSGATGGTSSAYAFADPSITIDPAYVAQYRIYGGLLGPPIPSTSGTPEPATWAMVVAGFGLVGAAVRRRRVVVA